jgi:hypothetical protein
MPHVLICDLFVEADLRSAHVMNSTVFTAVRRNQNERYHHLSAAHIGDSAELPDLFLDFKKVYGLPTENLYKGIALGGISRIAVIPEFRCPTLPNAERGPTPARDLELREGALRTGRDYGRGTCD